MKETPSVHSPLKPLPLLNKPLLSTEILFLWVRPVLDPSKIIIHIIIMDRCLHRHSIITVTARRRKAASNLLLRTLHSRIITDIHCFRQQPQLRSMLPTILDHRVQFRLHTMGLSRLPCTWCLRVLLCNLLCSHRFRLVRHRRLPAPHQHHNPLQQHTTQANPCPSSKMWQLLLDKW